MTILPLQEAFFLIIGATTIAIGFYYLGFLNGRDSE